MENLYFNDYDTYFNFIKKDYSVRYNGLIDFVIPYYNTTKKSIDRLYESISSLKNIEKCVVYLVNDCSNEECEKYVIEKFSNANFLTIFLKTPKNSGPGVTRNTGILNSFNKYIFLLDSDDYFINENLIEDSLETIGENPFLLVKRKTEQHLYDYDFFVKREYLLKNNILFGSYYCQEDTYFNDMLLVYDDNEDNMSSWFGAYYTNDEPTRTGALVKAEESFLCEIYTKYLVINTLLEKKNYVNFEHIKAFYLYFLDIQKVISTKMNDLETYDNLDFYILSMYNLLYYIYKNFKLELDIDKNSLNKNQSYWYNKIEDENFQFNLQNGETISTKEELSNYLNKHLDNLDQESKYYSSILKSLKKMEKIII